MSTVTIASLAQQLAWELMKYENAIKKDETLAVRKAIRLKIKELEKQLDALKKHEA